MEVREDILNAINDRLEPLELVELLDLSVEDLLEAFEDRLTDKLPQILEYIDYDDEHEQSE